MDYYDTLIVQRGAADAAQLLADECRKKDRAITDLRAELRRGCENAEAMIRGVTATEHERRLFLA